MTKTVERAPWSRRVSLTRALMRACVLEVAGEPGDEPQSGKRLVRMGGRLDLSR